jgi:Sulfatase
MPLAGLHTLVMILILILTLLADRHHSDVQASSPKSHQQSADQVQQYPYRFLRQASSGPQITQTNLLLIMFDDLRPELSIYGRGHMITPNFERLAARSVVFDHAYCQVAVCNPSRDSLMTGLRPDTTGTYAFQSSYKPHLIFPTQLKRSGYAHTYSPTDRTVAPTYQ